MSNEEMNVAGKIKLSDKLVDFIQNRRVLLLSLLIGLIAILAITGGILAFIDTVNKKATASIETLSSKYDEIRALTDGPDKEAKLTALVDEVQKNTQGSFKKFARARAFALLGSIYADKKDWTAAESAWISGSEIDLKLYIAPVCLYNAATAAEERGDGEKAIQLFSKCADTYLDSFPLASRAYFAVGRLNEAKNDFEAAKSAYKKIIDTWPNDGWSKLANSRILAIDSVAAN